MNSPPMKGTRRSEAAKTMVAIAKVRFGRSRHQRSSVSHWQVSQEREFSSENVAIGARSSNDLAPMANEQGFIAH
jgi:hypothetical protein